MAYQITYNRTRKSIKRIYRLPLLIVSCFLIFGFFVKMKWPEGTSVLEQLPLFPEKSIVVSQLNYLADEMRYSDSLIDTFAIFFEKLRP